MNNTHENKPIKIVVIVFAVIGLISMIAAGVYGMKTIITKIKSASTEKEIITKVELDDPANQGNEGNSGISSEVIVNSDNVATLGPTSSGELNGAFEDVSFPETNPNEEVEEIHIEGDGRRQIVIFGDSIFDNFRDETGIDHLLGGYLDAKIINLAVGGSCASVGRDDATGDDTWDSTCGAGLAKAVVGKVDPGVFRDCTAKNLLIEHKDDFKNTDIFIIEYGINDFMLGRTIDDAYDLENVRNYGGALRHMVRDLSMAYPDAKIVMCQPSYVEFYRENGEYVGNTYVLNNGPGTEYDYGAVMGNIARENGCYFFSIEQNGITMLNASETLLDGVHLNEKGRQIYATNLAEFIKKDVLGVY